MSKFLLIILMSMSLAIPAASFQIEGLKATPKTTFQKGTILASAFNIPAFAAAIAVPSSLGLLH